MTDMDTEVHHNIGRHDAQIEALQRQIAMLHTDMQSLNHSISAIQQVLAEAKGGWRTLMWVAGASGAAGVLATKIVIWLTSLPSPK